MQYYHYKKPLPLLTILFLCLFVISCNYSTTPVPEYRNISVKFDSCKSHQLIDSKTPQPLSSSEDCIEYEYDGKDTFHITHINAGFNCCPGVILAKYIIISDTIFILESEAAAQCDCDCLFDIKYSLSDIKKQKYIISVYEPYATENDIKLEFVIDLKSKTGGKFCVERNHYPWGM